jgi:hypothetical protein
MSGRLVCHEGDHWSGGHRVGDHAPIGVSVPVQAVVRRSQLALDYVGVRR